MILIIDRRRGFKVDVRILSLFAVNFYSSMLLLMLLFSLRSSFFAVSSKQMLP